MEESKKDKQEFLKIKLDFLKPFLTTLIVLDAGLVGYLFLNFSKNSLIINIFAIIGVLFISALFIFILVSALKILEEMKGLLK